MAAPPTHVRHDGFLAMFVPESDLDGLQRFHFIVKRTYQFVDGELLEPAEWQRTLVQADQYAEGGGPYDASLKDESELSPPIETTDVLVWGNIYAPGGEATFCRPSIAVTHEKGLQRRELLVMGDRFAILRPGVAPVFTPAARFSVLPMRWELCYGGVERQHSASPLLCPTNPIGTGFMVSPLDGDAPRDRWTPLPNIENPSDPCTVDNLVVPHDRINRVRSPASFLPFPKHWEPRAQRAGMPASAKPFWTLLHGSETQVGQAFKETQADFWSSAAPGMTFPRLLGHEKLTLKHLSRTSEEVSFRLPTKNPRLRAAFDDGPMLDVALSIARVSVDVEHGEVVVNWRGTLNASEGLTLEKLKRLPIELDGALALPAPLVGTGFPLDLLRAGPPGAEGSAYPTIELLDPRGLPKPGGL